MRESQVSECHAVVVAGGLRTEYVARGNGPAAVYLSARSREAPAIPASSNGLRIFAPVVPLVRDAQSFGAWLDGFLDGLGLGPVHLIVDTELESFGRLYGSASPERVRIVDVRQPLP